MNKKIKLFGIVACYNRIEKTKLFLQSLYAQKFPDHVDFQLYLYDDASSDGTVEMITSHFPKVKIICGEGGAYWAGGMRKAWDLISDKFDNDSMLLVLNDDVILMEDAIERFFSVFENNNAVCDDCVFVLSMLNSFEGPISYGGLKNVSRLGGFIFETVIPDLIHFIQAETLNMNAALIPASVIEKIGFLDVAYAHHRADIDFGFRLNMVGGKILVAPGYYGFCENDSDKRFVKFSNYSFWGRIKFIIHPKNEPVLERLKFYCRHGKLLWPIFFLSPYLLIIIPFARSYLAKLKLFRRIP